MPRARANMSAKLSAQIDTGVNLVVITRAPAATSSPAMVSSRGRPAATRLPKAMTRMMIVTGHDSISDLSMAERLAVLKLAHRALSPGEGDADAGGGQGRQLRLHGVGRLHHLVGVRGRAGGDDGGPAVLRDRDPGLGWDDGGHPRIAPEHLGRLRHGGLGLRIRCDRTVVVDDHHLQSGGTEAGEVLFDDGPGGDGLAVRRLPPGPGQGVLDVDGEDPEHQEHQQPGDQHPTEVGGGPPAEPGERTGVPCGDLAVASIDAASDRARPVVDLGFPRRMGRFQFGSSGCGHEKQSFDQTRTSPRKEISVHGYLGGYVEP